MTFKVAPDYEVDPQSYSFTVIADDGNGGTATQSVTVNVADVTEGPVVPPTPTGGEVLTFDDLATDTVEAAVPEFGGVARDIVTVTEEDGSSRQMLSVTKADGADPWAGFEFINAYSASDLVGDGTQPVTMRVFADQAGTLTLGLEGDAPKIELSETVEAGWNNVVFDVSSAADADPSKAVMHIDFASGAATNTGAVTYLIDDVHFPQAVIVEAPVVATPEEAAPAFTADADDVAIFIDAPSPGVNVNPGWGQRGSLLPETDAEAGEILKFSDLNYQGIDFGGSYDVSGKEHVRFDLWSETGGSVKVSAISPGAEKALDVTITGGEWNTVELDLADYSDVVDLTQVIQLKFDAQGLADGLNTFYMDNVAFAGTIAPVNENAPEFNYDSVFLQQNENIDTTQVIHNASATDADGDDVTYSLGGNDADAFDIDEDTGAVTFAESPDYESGVTSYDFTVTASDGSLTDEQVVTVQINNVVEQYTLDAVDLASGGEFVGEAMDDRMDGRGATSALELSGGAGTDVLYGGDAGDILDGGEGNDQLSGGGGDDVLIAGTGVDRIDGGDGIDTVVLDSDDGDMVSINLAREWQYSGDGWNQIVNVENVVTGGGADIIKGNDIGNVVESGAGNDWIYANGGDDVLIGGEGIDRLFGGDGNDTVLYETDDNLVIDLNTEWQLGNGGTDQGIDKLIDIENVTTGSGADVLIGNDGANILTGGDGDDTLTGGDGADVFRFYSSEGPSTDTITDFGAGDSIELIDDTTGEVAQAQITTDASGSTVTWDDLTIVLDVNVNYDDINPITD